MELFAGFGPHAGFIVASYGATIAILGGLVLWIVTDYRRQRREMAELEASGVRRRSRR